MPDETQSPYDAVIADLEQKRSHLTAAIDLLKALRSNGTVTALPVSGDPSRAQQETEIPRDAFFGMTIPEASKKYLSIVKVTKANPDLCNALLAGGFKTQSNNFSEVVRSTLQRHPEFVKVSGQWGLAEWYGGRGGSNRRPRRTLTEQVSDGEKSEGPSESHSDGPSED